MHVGISKKGNMQYYETELAYTANKNHYGNNKCTHSDETSPSYTVLFLHSQHLTHGMRCKQTDAGSKAREVDSGTHAGYPHHSCSHLKRCFPVAVFLPVCRQFAARRPPVYICLTASREPGPSSALSIRELSPAGSPHRCCAY